MKYFRSLTLLSLGFLTFCRHTEPTSPPPDALPDAGWTDPIPDEDPELLLARDHNAAACVALQRLRCPEAHPTTGESCLASFRHAEATHMTDLKPTCVAKAKTDEDLAICGTVRCRR